MDRILGIDYGERRIGLAISDPLNCETASPLEVVKNDQLAVRKIANLIKEYSISKVVLGRPLNTRDKETESTKKVDRFSNGLSKNIECDIVHWDEQFTTVEANEILISADVSRKKRKDIVDKLAAVFILQSYLDIQKKT